MGHRRASNVLTMFFVVVVFFLGGVAYQRHRAVEPPVQQPTTEPAAPTFRLLRVVDGDTVELIGQDGIGLIVRLRGADAPERNQPFGREASHLLSRLLEGAMDVRQVERGSFNRYEADLWANGQLVAAVLVKSGLAWCGRGSYFDTELCQIEANAKAEKRGLWVDPTAVAPWDWRARRSD